MKKVNIAILSFFVILLSICSNLPFLQFSTATPTLTLTPSETPTKTPVPTNTPTPTITPRPIVTIEPYSNLFPLNKPVLSLSDEQIKQVRECDVENLAKERYPEKNKSDDLIYLFTPESSCDWASLAYAYAVRLKDDEKMPDVAKNAFGKAIVDNIGFALSTPLFYRYYYDNFTIIESPDIFKQEIVKVQIVYKWGGMGDQVEYTIDIKQADTDPIVTIKNYTPSSLKESAKTKIRKDMVQAIGKSLINLIPIDSQFSLTTCYDNYPDWTTTLTLKNGAMIELKTNESNMLYIGGPWQVNIDGQNYIQFSIEFIKAIDTIIQEIGLPYGQPMAMTCGARDVFEQAYP
ncbi:MAG: hypothetical protein ACOYZ6_18865 [Chloroflexota bacterium]